MDLRPYINEKQVRKGIELIEKGDLFYQPFILTDDIEVGEGQNFVDRYAGVNSVFDLNVYAPDYVHIKGKRAPDLKHFRKCNQEYRQIYEHYTDVICQQFDNDISTLTFAEIGCNTGLNLFNLAARGAKKCAGYDWNDMSVIFGWLNDILNVDVRFRQGTYDNLKHQFNFDVPEADVMINTVFTNHQCDILQFLCYLCDRARKGVFLSCLTRKDNSDYAIYYPPLPPAKILDTGRPFPLYFNNGVEISEKLLLLALDCLGFGEVKVIDKFVPSTAWGDFQSGFSVYYAKRTSDIRSAYYPRRNLLFKKLRKYIS